MAVNVALYAWGFRRLCHRDFVNCDKIITGYSFSCTIHMLLPQQEFEPGHYHRVVSLDKKLDFALSLFTQVYKWVPAI